MTTTKAPAGGTFTMAQDLTVTRMGYGAMQLAGPGVFGPPADRAAAITVLRNAIECGVTHIDTADYYGPYVTNEIIKEALHPYPESLHIATKVGALRDAAGNWPAALAPEQVRQAVYDNLDRLGLDVLDVVNLRIGSTTGTNADSIAEPFAALAELQRKGLIKHLGLSNVSPSQIREAQSIAPIVCVQNLYNLTHRHDDGLIDSLAAHGIAYVPYFPLGGFTPLHSQILESVAAQCKSTPFAVALAWLLQRSPNILLIPGTSSTAHLQENLAAAELALPENAIAELDRIGSRADAASTQQGHPPARRLGSLTSRLSQGR
ncbi:oxidoreductase [Mycobacteroides chelonae]|uniref:oxidoreductase n=1 Tax=Mycobacteroides chelonae TaxID=1774 RepID=UPI0009BD13E4|nr:oxidoreductase [Mycobacteroides chelonae]QQG85965.1 oxidoreductase [Mycobacteroides chelonae]QQG90782.1 oxidoreductase [Mycobacteroides chelonae]